MDAVLFCHWPAMQLRRRLDVPTVIDFHGPHMLERAFQQMGLMPEKPAARAASTAWRTISNGCTRPIAC